MRLAAISAILSATVVSAALAQYPNQFRDPVTGQIWTPENVGRGPSHLSRPENRAFNPQAQTTVVQGTSVQTPNVTPIGTVPITAGPTAALLTAQDPFNDEGSFLRSARTLEAAKPAPAHRCGPRGCCIGSRIRL